MNGQEISVQTISYIERAIRIPSGRQIAASGRMIPSTRI